MIISENGIATVKVVHLDWCTKSCRGSVAVIGNTVVGAYLRTHKGHHGQSHDVIVGSWCLAEDGGDWTLSNRDIDVAVRFARKCGTRREAYDAENYLCFDDRDNTYYL